MDYDVSRGLTRGTKTGTKELDKSYVVVLKRHFSVPSSTVRERTLGRH